MRYNIKHKILQMNEVELFLIDEGENCTIYTLQFLRDVESEFEKFVSKFRDDAEYSEDFIVCVCQTKSLF